MSWHLDSWWIKRESRISGLHPSIIHLSKHHLAVWKAFFSMTRRSGNGKREGEALKAPYQPLITLHRYSNHSPWSFHPGSASTTFPNSPPWRFSSLKTLIPIMQITKERTSHAFISFSLLSDCLEAALLPSQEQMLFWKMLLPCHSFLVHWQVPKDKLGMRSSFSFLSWSVDHKVLEIKVIRRSYQDSCTAPRINHYSAASLHCMPVLLMETFRHLQPSWSKPF